MRKRVKYGLVAGVVVAAGLAVFLMSSGSGRLPTLPTPPGVVVPEGMRYVGGDEFESFDASRWIAFDMGTIQVFIEKNHKMPTEAELAKFVIPKPRFECRDGMLVFDSGKINRSLGAIDHRKFTLGKKGRIEIRARVEKPTGLVLPSFFIGLVSRDSSPSGISFSPGSGSERPPGLPDIFPRQFHHPADGDGKFHTYAFEWDDGAATFRQDGVAYCAYAPGESGSPLLRSRFPGIAAKYPWLPEDVSRFLMRAKKHADPAESVGLTIGTPSIELIKGLDGIPKATRLEIDYVRIFQK